MFTIKGGIAAVIAVMLINLTIWAALILGLLLAIRWIFF